MSVINQMLRELDARKAVRSASALLERTGPARVARAGLPLRHRTVARAAGLALLGAVGLAAAWEAGLWAPTDSQPARVAPANVGPTRAVSIEAMPSVASTQPQPTTSPAATAQAAPGEAAPAEAPQGEAPSNESLAVSETVFTLRLDGDLERLPAPRRERAAASPQQARAALPAPADVGAAYRPVPDRVATWVPRPSRPAPAAATVADDPTLTRPTATTAEPTSTGLASPGTAATTRKQVALADTLQAARDMLDAGHTAAAAQLLRAALQADGLEAQPRELRAALVNDLARLELLRRDPAAALAVLQQRADWIAHDPQGWTLRGNAAQRLGQHGEALAAFEQALALRPQEAPALLGAAVSQAARGDTPAAQATLARARGVRVPAEVARFLREHGVAVEP